MSVTTIENETAVDIVGRFLKTIPVDLDRMARALGVSVHRVSLGGDIAGKIERAERGYRITLNANDNPRRQRFTLAHEIAHFVLHRDLIGDGITDSGLYRSSLKDDIERQANRYAADLLMPAAKVRELWREDVRSIAGMADRFDVSSEAAEIRLKYLGYGP